MVICDIASNMVMTFKILTSKLDNRVQKIQIYLDENQMIEGIKITSHFDETNFHPKERGFGKTTKAENICTSCELELAEDELITGLSYRKSTAGVGNFESSEIRKYAQLYLGEKFDESFETFT